LSKITYNLFVGVVLLGCLFTIPSRGKVSTPAESGIDWSRNIAHIALDVEKELHPDYVLSDLSRGFVFMEDNHELLDRIFEKAEKRITVRERYGEKEVVEIARAMHEILEEEGFTYRDYSTDAFYFLGANVFGYGLAKREIDCVAWSLLGLGMAEHLGLPLAAVYMPGHFALRWLFDDGRYLNLELSIPAKCDDDYYISWKNISPGALERGVYLRNLSRAEVIAQQYYSLGLVWESREKWDKASSAVGHALRLFRDFPDAYNLRGLIRKAAGEVARAVEDFDTAIVLDEQFIEALANRERLTGK
jgi:regulator of sirC expression with transglutaminase-like and TPR domain